MPTQYPDLSAGEMKGGEKGPNGVRCVIWAIGTHFFKYFFVYFDTKVMIYFIYGI